MDVVQVGQLIIFVLLIAVPLLLLDVAMRRAKPRGGGPARRD